MPSATPEITDDESKQATERALPRAAIVFETIRREGEGELERSNSALAFSGLAAGLSMGFSLIGVAMLRAALPEAPWRQVVEQFGYSLGFLIVILGRQQLFTENTLTPILPLLDAFSPPKFVNVLRLWGIVLATNVAGALLFALALAHGAAFPAPMQEAFLALGRQAAQDPFWTQFQRAIYAGWLIALMVWILPASEELRPVIVLLLTYVVGAAGLSHIVAGSVETGYAAWMGAISWQHFLFGFFVPVLIGNIVGGVTLVALLNFGQIVTDDASPAAQGEDARAVGRNSASR